MVVCQSFFFFFSFPSIPRILVIGCIIDRGEWVYSSRTLQHIGWHKEHTVIYSYCVRSRGGSHTQLNNLECVLYRRKKCVCVCGGGVLIIIV